MPILFSIAIFIFGLIVGSFLNVVIYRYKTGRTVGGRSACMSCGRVLHWYELIPVISFLVQRARCRGCGSAVSWQYPLVELMTGALFVLSFLKAEAIADLFLPLMLNSIFLMMTMSILIVIIIYDIRHTIIPDPFVFAFIALAGVTLFVDLPTLTVQVPDLWHLLAGPILAAPFAFLWLVSGGRWMGFGDAKLAWGIGWLLGVSAGLSGIIFGFWIGALYGIVAIGLSTLSGHTGRFTMKSEVPFAPFLILGTLLVLFFDLSAFGILDLIV